MQVTKTETKPGFILWFVEVFEKKYFQIFKIQYGALFIGDKDNKTQAILHQFNEGNYEIIGFADEISEEQAKELVGTENNFLSESIWDEVPHRISAEDVITMIVMENLQFAKFNSGYKENPDTRCLILLQKK